MNQWECLLEDHKELRRLTAEIAEVLREERILDIERLQPEAVKRLSVLHRRLTDDIKAHEELEERLMADALKEMGSKGARLLGAVRSDHDSIHEVFKLLDALMSIAYEESAYSIDFTVSCLRNQLERHLDYEEKEIFPTLKRLWSPTKPETEACSSEITDANKEQAHGVRH